MGLTVSGVNFPQGLFGARWVPATLLDLKTVTHHTPLKLEDDNDRDSEWEQN
jgi:hypothetical protein